jgi:carboxyl-terminal processing protease
MTGRSHPRRTLPPIAMLALSSMLAACGDAATGPESFNAVETFDRFWLTFDENYSYFDYKRISWDSLGEAHRPAARNIDSPTQLVTLLKAMTLPLRDVHVSFTSPTGEHHSTWVPQQAANWDQATWARHVTANGWQQQPNWGHARLGDIGYIAIGGWTAGVDTLAVDAVLESFRDLPAIIIDVRPNGGGDDRIALRVAGRFADQRRHIETVRFRNGPRHADLGPPTQRFLERRGGWQYTKAVVVLTGRAAFSSNETFIAAMRELPHVTLIGDTTGGSSGNPGNHQLAGGWTYRVPRWIAYLVDGTVIEWNGVPPDIALPTPELEFGGEMDPVIEYAESWLRQRLDDS